ncbi:MAG: hypothetical protein CMI54_07745 [Parcubacteria group bacterium]|nr:hypothetical protein [Parcubacteria group bacterium]|tara:strand:+ start:17014 stop:17310 length:297 start_codon:yes stop_codon:yes gene_type:complete
MPVNLQNLTRNSSSVTDLIRVANEISGGFYVNIGLLASFIVTFTILSRFSRSTALMATSVLHVALAALMLPIGMHPIMLYVMFLMLALSVFLYFLPSL